MSQPDPYAQPNPRRTAAILSAATCGLLIVAGALAACSPNAAVSEDKKPTPAKTAHQVAETTKPSPTLDTSKAVEKYMEALSSKDPVQMQKAANTYAKPGSVAAAYLGEQADVLEATLDGGQVVERQDSTRAGDAFKICAADGTNCGTFTDFKVSKDGQLTDLTVNGKSPSPLLTDGSGKVVTEDGIKFEFLSAYRAITGNGLWVNVKITSADKPITTQIYQATYRSPDGAQRKAGHAAGPSELEANSSANVTLVFPGVKPGGTVTLTGVETVNYSDDFAVTLKVG